jgi:hypothetical protein
MEQDTLHSPFDLLQVYPLHWASVVHLALVTQAFFEHMLPEAQ